VASMRDMGAWLGMLVVETMRKSRRAYFVQQKPIKRSAGSLACRGKS